MVAWVNSLCALRIAAREACGARKDFFFALYGTAKAVP
jgi:hypothetical protein